jgi:protein dithiol oxidoreductase (disulfide-forming)
VLRKMWLALLGLALGLMALPVAAQGGDFIEGRDYIPVAAVAGPDDDGADGVAVDYFFMARCPHCYGLEPDYQAWLKRQPADVHAARVQYAGMMREPAFAKQAMEARGWHTAVSLGVAEALYQPMYETMMADGGWRWNDEEAWIAFFTAHGISDDVARDVFNSDEVVALQADAHAQWGRYEVRAAPTFVVGGRYSVERGAAKTPDRFFAIVDFLIAKVRQERAGGR